MKKKLRSKEKQAALEQTKALVLATLDYLTLQQGESIVLDGWDLVGDVYRQQKHQAEKYFTLRRLDRLQQQLRRLTGGLRHSADLRFGHYIREKTGYELDIFEEIRRCADAVVYQGEIKTEEESQNVWTMLRIYEQTRTDPLQEAVVRKLLHDYYQSAHAKALASKKRKNEYTEVIKRVEHEDYEEVTMVISTGPRPKHFKETEDVSPNGRRILRVTQWSDGKHSSTCVTIAFKGASGCIYSANGIYEDIKAYWKDDGHIVVETRKEYEVGSRHQEARSFEDVVKIQYVEL